MTRTQACQLASQLLKSNADPSDTMNGVLCRSYVEAITKLRDLVATAIATGKALEGTDRRRKARGRVS